MEENLEIEMTTSPSVKVQFVRLLLGVSAGFVATKLTERAVDAFIAHRAVKTV